MNKVILLGNLTRDPDLRGLPSGQSVCELGLAVSRRYQNSSGQEVEDTCFVDVVVWGRAASNCKQYLAKGSQVLVEGRLQLDRWEDRNGGGQRSRLRVVAEQVQFMNRRSENSNGGAYAPQSSAYNPQNQGGYPPPAGDYAAPRQGNYPPPADSAYSDTYSRSSVRPAQPPMPPMPDPGMPGDMGDAGVDNIPF